MVFLKTLPSRARKAAAHDGAADAGAISQFIFYLNLVYILVSHPFLLKAVVNIAYVVMSEESPAVAGWLTWRDVLHILDIICCCLVLFPIVWSIRQLRESASVDGRAEVTFQRLVLFRAFYVQVVVFVYFTRIVAYLVRATLPCRHSYMSDVASECATLLFFLTAGFKFRPRPENP